MADELKRALDTIVRPDFGEGAKLASAVNGWKQAVQLIGAVSEGLAFAISEMEEAQRAHRVFKTDLEKAKRFDKAKADLELAKQYLSAMAEAA